MTTTELIRALRGYPEHTPVMVYTSVGTDEHINHLDSNENDSQDIRPLIVFLVSGIDGDDGDDL